MNVTTIGFPFGAASGVPALGTPGQDFALALGAAGLNAPMMPGVAANDKIARPANDAAPLSLSKSQIVRTQPGAPITLAQLLTTGSTVPATVTAVQPGQIATGVGAQVPADATPQSVTGSPAELPADAAAQIPVKDVAAIPSADAVPAPVTDKTNPVVTPATETIVSSDPKSASPDPAVMAQTDVNEPVACPTAVSEQPTLLDLPTATRPKTDEIAPTAIVATPVKTRKPLAIDGDAAALPVDPLTAQPATTSTPVVVAGSTPPPAPMVATPERKPDAARGGKTAPVALGQPNVAAASDVMTPAANPKEPVASSSTASLPDAALPTGAAPKIEAQSNSAPLPQQSFASHVTQNTAQAPVHANAPSPAAAASDPMIPARAGQLGHALGVEIARKVGAGEDTLRVRLNPVELGRVEVTLAFDDRGNMRATMRAESQHALDLLRQDAPDLGRALDSAGIRADAQSFRFESRSDGNGGSAGGQTGQHQSRGNSQHAFNDEPETPAPAYRAIRNDGQVDLLA
ncbi:flagellar hook-length control protein FliK [Sphingomonas sp. JC676]|uniref:flagellar hook-length control protein FliK n=1 Tax=Sphingomonas sp. JC676 TaxID=2768065 RepID=UPI001657CF84|nr:flagellar hook-length control protein FliK [Sphingomonas sp. JC676]MBC9032564.1 flagellar hook-length control protein FliK [Sphingomonas sp. JC676]